MLKFLTTDIINIIPEGELANKIIESNDFAEKFANDKSKKLSNLKATSPLNVDSAHTTSTKKKVNLLKLQLPNFDGCLIKW